MIKRILVSTFSVSLLALVSLSANATLITIEASGITDWVSQPADMSGMLDKTFNMTIVYDDATSDANASLDRGDYGAGIVSMYASIDGQALTLSPHPESNSLDSLNVLNNYGGPDFFDEFTASTDNLNLDPLNVSLGGLGPYTRIKTGLRLSDSSQTVFSDDSLPTTLDLADFDLGFMYVLLFPQTNDFNTRVDATITSLTVTSTSVPEPSVLALMATGLFGLG